MLIALRCVGRIKHDLDLGNALAYPLRIFEAKMRRRKCRVCDLYPAV